MLYPLGFQELGGTGGCAGGGRRADKEEGRLDLGDGGRSRRRLFTVGGVGCRLEMETRGIKRGRGGRQSLRLPFYGAGTNLARNAMVAAVPGGGQQRKISRALWEAESGNGNGPAIRALGEGTVAAVALCRR
ncbi:hypothetical protein HPP92_003512 [Vanilla planifolia]|uniref:Uncharacterized protein n=1 Tax=Vanilla planifolia TaxID=51239 RepID=A0A835VJH0_VANPL|nr:hypothetical protein HPP92_003512 [Vanilla planifolia]